MAACIAWLIILAMEGQAMHPERYFSSDPIVRGLAVELYESIRYLPILCPHGHVDAQLFVDPNQRFGNPTELFITPDHYLIRALYAHGIALEALGIQACNGDKTDLETDPKRVWKLFCSNFHIFAGTPTGLWVREELAGVFGFNEIPSAKNADHLYLQLSEMLQSEHYSPRRLYERFNIEALCTTDAATDNLSAHQALQKQTWSGRILPTFRPDKLIDLENPTWITELAKLEALSGKEITTFSNFIRSLEDRRAFFIQIGAKASDHGVRSPYTAEFSPAEIESIFQRALRGSLDADDARKFSAQMLMEMARMSCEDGLVMQVHAGSYRNHNQPLFEKFGPDMGADIPVRSEFTQNLAPLLCKFGNSKNLTLVLFTLDESCYGRELAPLAGHYPAVKLGPPWWFFDSLNGIQRYFDAVVETAGFYNLAGFNDDTRAFCSIPARHDLWRRASANWLAGQAARHMLDMRDAKFIAQELAYGLAKRTYNL
ncbi:MAG TPA: glucuronate isomerase [Anaerolineaceae bacterium]|nr:glucuronate isomerase [Anaerolineaceae bacterium]